MKTKFLISALVFSLIFSGCASIIHGSSQSIDFNSQPSRAKITIDGKEYGTTPHTIELKRMGRLKGESKDKKEYKVKIELDGYFPYEFKIKREMDGWFLGNILFGGLIGIIVDSSNGSMYKLNPDQIVATLGRATVYNNNNEDKIYISFSLTPNPSWEKIGELSKEY